jgi:hypothetical protein
MVVERGLNDLSVRDKLFTRTLHFKKPNYKSPRKFKSWVNHDAYGVAQFTSYNYYI